MGLDGVELVLAFEEAFGVTITDGEAAKTVTPGMVIDLVCSKLELTDEKTCQSQRSFYLLRRALMKSLNKQRNQISPDVRLADLFPSWDCTPWWNQLKEAVDARSWPKLSRPFWIRKTIPILMLAAFVSVPYFLYRKGGLDHLSSGIFAGFGTAIVLGIGLAAVTNPLRRAIPARVQTVRDLVPFAATSNTIKWSRELVAQKVKEIVIEQLSLDESKYSEKAHFVEDLGIG